MRTIYLFIFTVLVSFTFVPVPFSRAEKQSPKGSWEQIIPQTVSHYTLTDLHLPVDGKKGVASYKSGSKEIRMHFNKFGTQQQLYEELSRVEKEMSNNKVELRRLDLKAENKYALYVEGQHFSFSWNKGEYYFSVNCKNGKEQMDEFMKAFPY